MEAYEADPNFKSRYRETERRAFGDASIEVAEQQDTERVRTAVIYFVGRPLVVRYRVRDSVTDHITTIGYLLDRKCMQAASYTFKPTKRHI